MDAASRLVEIADAFAEAKLEAILIGNAGAALHGAPVTTFDFDFLYRRSLGSRTRLRQAASLLDAQITQPSPAAFRILRPDSQLQINLTAKSFKAVRASAAPIVVDGRVILVAPQRTAQPKHLALPMNKRTNFLRLRLPNGGSCL